jgi:hypothetical protein
MIAETIIPADAGDTTRLDWATLVNLEPRLADLLRAAQNVEDDGKSSYFCGNAVWFGYNGHLGLKPRLVGLVGFDRRGVLACDDLRLYDSPAYDVAYSKVYSALPPCRGECGCM